MDGHSTLIADTLLQSGQAQKARMPRLLSGSVVGHYQILGHLGSGGMGAVYRARDQRLGRQVALKLKRPQAEGTTSCRVFCTLLQREGQAMGQLSHPNVLAVYDVGLALGCVYLAIEFVDGVTLRVWSSVERSLPDRLATLRAAGAGLTAAHEAGIVHRDFKPDNVLVGADRVKVCDFGIARTQAQILEWGISCGGCGAQEAEDELRNSVDGDSAGTPAYMAPEQLAGEPATERSDQYAFAVTAWETLCGVYPYRASTVGELRTAIDEGNFATPVHEVPPSLLAAVRRGMSRDPDARYPGVDALLAALET